MVRFLPGLAAAIVVALSGCSVPPTLQNPVGVQVSVITLAGQVLDVEGGSIQDALVAVATDSGPGVATTTDRIGRYQMAIEPSARCVLAVSKVGFGQQDLRTTCDVDRDLDFRLTRIHSAPVSPDPSHRVSVIGQVVTTGTGVGVAGARVQAIGATLTETNLTSSTGNFQLALPAGPYRIETSASGYEDDTFEFEATEAAQLRIELQQVSASQPLPPFWFSNTGHQGGEPTVGATSLGAIFVQSRTETLRSVDQGATWTVVNPFLTGIGTADPLLWVDNVEDRVFVSQLMRGCSVMAWSDDEGETWFEHPIPCAGAVSDHPSLSTGPYASTPLTGATYPRIVYYCAHANVMASCQRSHDGGLTWLPPFGPTHTSDNATTDPTYCHGTHGQIHIGPRGTAFLPLPNCYLDPDTRGPGIVVSKDNGQSWTLRVPFVPGSQAADPFVVQEGRRLHVVYMGVDNGVRLIQSEDEGVTWSAPIIIKPANVLSQHFPLVAVDSGGRLGIAYLGNRESGQGPDDAPAHARWHLFLTVAHVNNTASMPMEHHQVTPDDDPIQIGSICSRGALCEGRRNLYDFNDMKTLPDGRFLVAVTDGCLACSTATESLQSETSVILERVRLRAPTR